MPQGDRRMQHFTNEITELRLLGFAESLPIHVTDRADDVVARLECGRIGVAVEFRASSSLPQYTIKALVSPAEQGLPLATDVWSAVVQTVHRRAPPNDDE